LTQSKQDVAIALSIRQNKNRITKINSLKHKLEKYRDPKTRYFMGEGAMFVASRMDTLNNEKKELQKQNKNYLKQAREI
jgi:hypothetical protein